MKSYKKLLISWLTCDLPWSSSVLTDLMLVLVISESCRDVFQWKSVFWSSEMLTKCEIRQTAAHWNKHTSHVRLFELLFPRMKIINVSDEFEREISSRQNFFYHIFRIVYEKGPALFWCFKRRKNYLYTKRLSLKFFLQKPCHLSKRFELIFVVFPNDCAFFPNFSKWCNLLAIMNVSLPDI